MAFECSLFAADEQALEAIGARLGVQLGVGLVAIAGPLGAGKTCLCRGVLRGYGYRGPVKSPTYTLVESYPLTAVVVHHFDLYRLGDPEELEFIGWRDYLEGDALTLVEWPERAAALLPVPDIRVEIQYVADGRRVELSAGSARGEAVLLAIEGKKS